MKMNVSKAVQSDRACSSRLCNDCTLRGPEMEMSTNLTQEDGKESARHTICYGIAGHSACVPSGPQRLPRISPRNCLLAGTSSISRSRSILQLLRESKRLCGVIYVNMTLDVRMVHYLSVARHDVRDDCGSDLCSSQEIARAVWISHPTSGRVLGRP